MIRCLEFRLNRFYLDTRLISRMLVTVLSQKKKDLYHNKMSVNSFHGWKPDCFDWTLSTSFHTLNFLTTKQSTHSVRCVRNACSWLAKTWHTSIFFWWRLWDIWCKSMKTPNATIESKNISFWKIYDIAFVLVAAVYLRNCSLRFCCEGFHNLLFKLSLFEQ